MLAKKDIEQLITDCRDLCVKHFVNGRQASIGPIQVDFLQPPNDFLGLQNNPAIFVSQYTYHLLGSHHPTWQVNQTIAVKGSFLDHDPMLVIGVIVHEMGHAFNVATGLTNSEANACVFEIEMLLLLIKSNHLAAYHCSDEDLQTYFNSRRLYYRSLMKNNDFLSDWVRELANPLSFNSSAIGLAKLINDLKLVAADSASSIHPTLAALFKSNKFTLFSHCVHAFDEHKGNHAVNNEKKADGVPMQTASTIVN